MKKAQGKVLVVIILVVIAVALVVIAYSLLNKPATTGNVVSNSADTYYAMKIMGGFLPMWRGTNYDCNTYNSQKLFGDTSYQRGELSFSLSYDNHEDTKLSLPQPITCYIQVNNGNPIQYTFTQEIKISEKDSTYIGTGNVFEKQNITIACGNSKETNVIPALCL